MGGRVDRPARGRWFNARMDAAAWDARYAASERVWSAEPNIFVAAECADLPPGRAVDLAAGEGRNALWLARLGWRVTAVDFAQAGLERGRLMAAEDPEVAARIDWVCADVTTWSAAPEADLVVMAYLQLVADQRRLAVGHAFDALAPGGTLVLVAHDATNLTEGTGGPTDAAVLYTAEDVLADLAGRGRGFDVIRAERVERHVGAPAGSHQHVGTTSAVAYDCLVRLRKG